MANSSSSLRNELGARYDLDEVLGEGGMGTVFLARDRKHDRLVAIKTVRSDLTTAATRERFEREISITAHLQHPYILPLLESGVAGETLYYVMPYVEGESLQDRLERDGKLPVDQVVRIARDVAEGLAHAHEHGVIHRDIKPGNILLTTDHAQIVDFGIAKALSETGSDDLTKTGWCPGSPNYMAPEQFSGNAMPQSDIYALGAVLFEAITGQQWKGGQNVAAADWAEIPTGLRSAIERALSPAPEKRWPDARSFRQAVGASSHPPTDRRRMIGLGGALAILLIGLSWWSATELSERRARVAEKDSIDSLAVLPLVNLMKDPQQDYFVAGMHEAVISELAKIDALKVISRTSVTRYADTKLSVPEIADQLGVAALLEGGVQRAGDRVRVNVQLIDAVSDGHLWAQTYDEELTTENIFAIQSDIARKIAEALHAKLAPETEGLMEMRPTESIEAYDLYSRGRYLIERSASREDHENAAELFRRALAADPDYAPAYVGMARTFNFLGGHGHLPAKEAKLKARAAVERALELDDSLAEGHAAFGSVLAIELHFDRAEREFQRALELKPNSAEVHQQYSRLLLRLERHEESIREARRAVELDPLSVGNRVSLTSRLYYARQFDSGIKEALSVLELEPNHAGALFFLGGCHSMSGQHEQGIAALQRSWELNPDNNYRATLLAWAYARSGRRDAAIAVLEQIDEGGPMLKEFAIVYGELGELDRAFNYLDRAYSEAPGSLTYMRADPTADALRTDQRFTELLQKVGLE